MCFVDLLRKPKNNLSVLTSPILPGSILLLPVDRVKVNALLYAVRTELAVPVPIGP